MQVDHGFAQPLEFLLGGLDKVPVLPVFINGVATPLPGFQRTRMLGEAIGRFTSTLNKRVLFRVPVGFPISRRCQNWRKPMPICATVCWGAGKIYPPVSANCVSNG
ncbi:hypothetical protein ECZU34_35840 [Escherichia coli]|nr:hypothetical protein ECZU34_35840 [Escherichia coli]